MITLGIIQVFVNKIALRFSNELHGGSKDIYQQVIAAWGSFSRVYIIITGVCDNVTCGYLTAASYALGAKLHKRFFQLSVAIIEIDCIVCLILSVIVAASADHIALIFSKEPFYVALSGDITRIFCVTGFILPLQFLSAIYCQATNLIGKGVAVVVITQIIMLPLLFAALFYGSLRLDPRKNFYVSMMSFNVNDIASGAASAWMLFAELK